MKKKYVVYITSALLIGSFAWVFLKNKIYYAQIPIKLSIRNTPLIEVEIQGKKYSLDMDLGSKFQLILDKQTLNHLDKKPSGTLLSRDMDGNSYETSAYLISRIKIGDFSFNDVTVKEQSDDFILNTTFWVDINRTKNTSEDRIGSLGRALLEKRNLLLDFHNSTIFISNDIKHLKKAGYNLKKFSKCFFETGRAGIILTADTEIGKTRLSLDTGSTISFIRSSLVANHISEKSKYGIPFIRTPKFEIGEKDFGNMNLYLHAITPELDEIDGILGMDFLKNHVVYIDYKDKFVYIGDNKNLSKGLGQDLAIHLPTNLF